MAYDANSPAQTNQALTDIDVMRTNVNAIRELEASLFSSPPSNPVAGMLWYATDTDTVYQRDSANAAWVYLWKESDIPAKASELTSHKALNITSAVTVHGIKQGTGNSLDADTVDGSHASDFTGASHPTTTTGVHGVGASTVESVSGSQAKVDAHTTLTNNPHNVTAAQVGAVGLAADNVIGNNMMYNHAAGSLLYHSNDTEVYDSSSGGFRKVKAIKLTRGGTYRVEFEIKVSAVDTAQAQIYRNGVGVGVVQSTASLTYELKTEDISGWASGDSLELWLNDSTAWIYAKNLRLYVTTSEVPYNTL